MRRYMSVKRLGALVLAAVLSVSAAFVSEAAASFKAEVPVTLHLDVNSRRTTIYDGYSSYLLGYRASRSEARRNVEQGGVSVDGNPVKDIKAVFSREQFAGDGVVVKRGKKNFKKIILK